MDVRSFVFLCLVVHCALLPALALQTRETQTTLEKWMREMRTRRGEYTVSAFWETCASKEMRVRIDNDLGGSAEITFTVVETGLTQTLAVVGLYAEESFLLDDILQDYHIDWYDTARPSYKSSILVNKCGTVDRDPHVTTFDGVKYEFQGPCTYVLTQDCSDINNPLFQITADFRGKYSELKSKYLTRIDAVNININGNQIVRILKDNTFLINGKLTKSYTVIGDNDGTVDIKDGHPTVTLYKVGLSLTWLKETSAVDISFTGSEMRGNVCGLLGNNNGNPDDDLMTPNGNIVSDVYEFGESWTVPGSCLVP